MNHLFYLLHFLLGVKQAGVGDIERGMNILTQDTMKLKITIKGHTVTALLYDSPTGRDFASLLPLTLKLEDYANTEKVALLSRKLTTQDAVEGFDPEVGDLTYYAPWGNLALFYKDFGYANGLIPLGKMTEGIEHLSGKGTVTIKIEWDQ